MGLFKGVGYGVALCVAVVLLVWRVSALPWNHTLQLSPLTLAIIAGMILGNVAGARLPGVLQPGLRFSQQKILRLGVMLYGIRLTVGDLWNLGPRALLLDVTVITCVLAIGYWLGTRVLRLDSDTALLVSAGSGICGAAAVLATDRVLESESHKASVAVATVVVFGTAAMFLYPFLYPLTGFTERTFGIYTGATVHEVAQVVAAGRAVGQLASDTAVVTKMLRVVLLAPALLLLGRLRRGDRAAGTRGIGVPWFVLGFVAVIVLQSWLKPPPALRSALIDIDTILLSSAMFALGVSTHWEQMKRAGTRPLLLGAILFGGLVTGGYLLTSMLVH